MTEKIKITGIICSIIIIGSYIFFQFYKANNIEENCFVNDFEEVFENGDGIILNKIYDFSKIFNCQSWDEIIIVGGNESSRTSIFFKEGIAVPEIDYINRASGCLLFYIIKDGKLISPPIEYWRKNFLYFQDFNDSDYVILKRRDAVFKCIELDYIGPKDKDRILTFELIPQQ